MRLRIGVACGTMTCAGAAIAISCVSNSDNQPPGGDDAGGFDAAQPDTSIAVTPDAGGTDTGPGVDSASPPPDDAGPGIDAAEANPGCVPSGAAFTPPAYVPAAGQQDLCTSPTQGSPADDVEDLGLAVSCTDAGDASTYAACRGYVPQLANDGGPDLACGACLLTNEVNEAGTWGPAVVGPAVVANVAGCIQLADTTDAGYSCAVAVQAAARCVEAQCKTNCPVSDDISQAAFLACAQAAATNSVCAPYTLASNGCIAVELDAGGLNQVGDFCVVSGADPVTQFEDIARFFCTS